MVGKPSVNEQIIIEMSGRMLPVDDIARVTKMTPASIYVARSRFKRDIEALQAQTCATLIETMSADLKAAAAKIASIYRDRVSNMTSEGEVSDKVALQILKMATSQFVERPIQKSEQQSFHVHLTLEQQKAFDAGKADLEGDFAALRKDAIDTTSEG